MLNLETQNRVSEEVIHASQNRSLLSKIDIEKLISLAEQTPRKRIRFCSHQSSKEIQHEMFIVHPYMAYVRPHKHLKKPESMFVLYGEVDYVMFDEFGNVTQSIQMGTYDSGKPFYHTIRTEVFHSLLIHSDWLVFLEVTQGPFDKENTVFAEWAPMEEDLQAVKTFVNKINK